MCPSGLDDIHVILKTGTTEPVARLLVHFNTTFRCVRNYTLFSDYEDEISGVPMHDVLRSVDERIKSTHPDFALYTHLREAGKAALSTWHIPDDPSTPSGKPNNPGWILDKWKFLPMMHETLDARPDAKWYVFMEADTYILWANLLAWLAQFNADDPFYLGNQMQIGDVIFAHGGSGFVLSRPALRRIVAYHSARVAEWDDYTGRHWAGDCVLGKALQNAGVYLLWSWPMMQGSTPWAFDHLSAAFGHTPWCYPPVAYHHMTLEDIREMWEFEQDWSRRVGCTSQSGNFGVAANSVQGGGSVVLYRDLFQKLMQPRFSQNEQYYWDNESADVIEGIGSVVDCEEQCALDAECLQFSYGPGLCRTSSKARRGSRKPGVISGWMADRINQTVAQLGSCKRIDWIRP
ncbi:hypothetical protein HFD88_005860 [Aspergillus terreus]|nr:hypothetical protein HFD88_005860 [Aspergillus terreus]